MYFQVPLLHHTRVNDLKFASEEKNGATFISPSVFYTSSLLVEKRFGVYVFVHDRTFVTLWDDTFEYYRNLMIVLSTLKCLTTTL